MPGDPQDPGTLCGPVISAKQRERVLGYIQKGVDEGATCLVGGPDAPTGFDKGFFVRPTLFTDVDNSMTIAQEEIFGPVLVVIPFDDEDDAVRIANDSPYGLAGNVMSGSLEHSLGRGPAAPRRLHRPQRHRGLRRRHAVRRLQGQRRRPPERRRRLRPVHRSQVGGLPGQIERSQPLSDLFDDLEDFGAFDDAVSGDVRDPYTELARLRREKPCSGSTCRRCQARKANPSSSCTGTKTSSRCCGTTRRSRRVVIQAFGDVLGKHVMLGMDEPEHGRHRALVSKAFSQKALARWEDELVGARRQRTDRQVRRPTAARIW